MIKFFRKFRQQLLSENKFNKYLIYAIGEIVLVVIGILIALQINNWNELRKVHGQEVTFLKGLKTDLLADQSQLDLLIEARTSKVECAIELLKPIPLDNYQQIFAADSMISKLFGWIEFVPQTNTFDELVSTGNLNIIKNDSIKSMLLELKRLHGVDHTYTEHMRREFDHYLYDRHNELRDSWAFGDLEASWKSKSRIFRTLSEEELQELAVQTKVLLDDRQTRNGLTLAGGNNMGLLNGNRNMDDLAERIINLIDKELGK